ncbi:ly6/PLAUR domain-containing protein 1 isoform X3 [Python bivittatus]|uniref:Ly6/PLAUR domain-containing protein 1 isoform X3 n=1 Tax=Python bivittatus TaxID=176946 RepID=A0A9F5MXQ2_PYTBI|nr:ly6/PLAUR domain-containing protein 1 isoform X3 [Python bivittatus]
MWLLAVTTTFWGLLLAPGFALQIQCYQCEEFQLNNDCSSPEFIVNCTVNVQDMCQKEVMEKSSVSCPRTLCNGEQQLVHHLSFLMEQLAKDP